MAVGIPRVRWPKTGVICLHPECESGESKLRTAFARTFCAPDDSGNRTCGVRGFHRAGEDRDDLGASRPARDDGAPEQSVYLADLSGALARRGHRVTFHTRRDDPDLPERVETRRGYNVVQVSAGPPRRLSDDEVLPAMGRSPGPWPQPGRGLPRYRACPLLDVRYRDRARGTPTRPAYGADVSRVGRARAPAPYGIEVGQSRHVGLGELYRRGVRTDSDGPPTLVHLRDSVSRRSLRMGRRQPEAASIASLVWERYCRATVSTH